MASPPRAAPFLLAAMIVLGGCAGARPRPISPDSAGGRAEDAYRRGDYAEALARAKAGLDPVDPRALHVLSQLEYFGDGVAQDRKDAVAKAEAAARGGDEYALAFLGWRAQAGLDAPRDDGRAAAYYARARRIMNSRAAAGEPRAQFALGQWLATGLPGVERDFAEALRWTRRSAAADLGMAEMTLGGWLRDGYGVAWDTAAAQALFSRGAARLLADAKGGDMEAMTYYGWALVEGAAMPRDAAGGLAWLLRAAEKNFSRAQAVLGTLHLFGDGVAARDPAQGLKWLRRAAEQGDSLALYGLGAAYQEGKGVERFPGRAVDYYRRAANQGLTDAMRALAALADSGDDTAASETDALRWRRLAADRGDAAAMVELAEMYRRGVGTAADAGQSVLWLGRAADCGRRDAMRDVGIAYLHGAGVKKDTAAAVRWFKRAVAADDQPSMTWLALIYQEGEGLPPDPVAAAAMFRALADRRRNDGDYDPKTDAATVIFWRKKAAALGDAASIRELCRIYRDGDGVDRDETAAAQWCGPAAQSATPSAAPR